MKLISLIASAALVAAQTTTEAPPPLIPAGTNKIRAPTPFIARPGGPSTAGTNKTLAPTPQVTRPSTTPAPLTPFPTELLSVAPNPSPVRSCDDDFFNGTLMALNGRRSE